MNTADKIAATYLRLNGFLLLPYFTMFEEQGSRHVDLIGLRAPGSRERAQGIDFLVDEPLFDALSQVLNSNVRNALIGIVGEVKSNDSYAAPTPQQFEYVQRFLGNAQAVRLSFSRSHGGSMISRDDQTVLISPEYAVDWILKRIDWVTENLEGRTKEGSWTWSEEFLADMLILKQYGKLKS